MVTARRPLPQGRAIAHLWSVRIPRTIEAEGHAQLCRSLDPVQVTQMAKYLETVYVSGWQCSSTASSTNEPGPDLAGERVPDAIFVGKV